MEMTTRRVIIAGLLVWAVALTIIWTQHSGSPERKVYEECLASAQAYSLEYGWTPAEGIDAWCVRQTIH